MKRQHLKREGSCLFHFHSAQQRHQTLQLRGWKPLEEAELEGKFESTRSLSAHVSSWSSPGMIPPAWASAILSSPPNLGLSPGRSLASHYSSKLSSVPSPSLPVQNTKLIFQGCLPPQNTADPWGQWLPSRLRLLGIEIKFLTILPYFFFFWVQHTLSLSYLSHK